MPRAEGTARLRMLAYARVLRCPQMHKAIGLNGWEGGRHKEVLSKLVEACGLRAGDAGGVPAHPAPAVRQLARLAPAPDAVVAAALLRGEGRGGADCAGDHDSNFIVTGTQAMTDEEIDIAELMDLCLSENDRRFAGYDGRLLRPATMPNRVRLARRFVRSRKEKEARRRGRRMKPALA